MDTPGIGDTEGMGEDTIITDQIKTLFQGKGEKGVTYLDAVCFVVKAPDERLTEYQQYVFNTVLQLFAKDMKDNICALITFIDGSNPLVQKALQKMNIPIKVHFSFNNAALFDAENPDLVHFWKIGKESYDIFLKKMEHMQTVSLQQTQEVLRQRNMLENVVVNLQVDVEESVLQINSLRKLVSDLNEKKTVIEVEEPYVEKIDISGKGIYTTHCLVCNYTCHNDCIYANDKDKKNCSAMNLNGYCNNCLKHCSWSQHSNVPFILKPRTRTVTATRQKLLEKFSKESGKNIDDVQQMISEISGEIKRKEANILANMEAVKECNDFLQKKALRHNPMTTVQYINLMIAGEKKKPSPDTERRIETLEKCKERLQIDGQVQNYLAEIKNAKKDVSDSKLSHLFQELKSLEEQATD